AGVQRDAIRVARQSVMMTIDREAVLDAIGVPPDQTVETAIGFICLQIGQAQHHVLGLATTIRRGELRDDAAVVENFCAYPVTVAQRVGMNGPAISGRTVVTDGDFGRRERGGAYARSKAKGYSRQCEGCGFQAAVRESTDR